MSRARTWLLLGTPVAVLAALGLAAVPALRGLVPASDVPLAEVRRGDFVRRVEAEGNLEAVNATKLTAPMKINMPVKVAWLAADGGRVDEGDVVVRFDATEFEKNLSDGEADRDSADGKIRQTEELAGATLENLERDAAMAGRELQYAREFQSKDAEIFSRSQIVESEIDERLATARREHAEDTRGIQQELSAVDVDLLKIERSKAELKIEQAQKGLAELELVAPHDGILVLERNWSGEALQVGTMVWRGNTVAEIPDLSEMRAKVFVLEADAGGLEAGLPAEVTLEAHPDRTYRATVGKVDALPKRRNRRVPIQYFEITLDLERTDPERMKPGQRVRAAVILDERRDVLSVPREAVIDDDGKKIVYRYRGGEFEPVEVVPGPAALGRVVIESGLAEGERVALHDPTRPRTEPGAGDEAPASPGPAAGAS